MVGLLPAMFSSYISEITSTWFECTGTRVPLLSPFVSPLFFSCQNKMISKFNSVINIYTSKGKSPTYNKPLLYYYHIVSWQKCARELTMIFYLVFCLFLVGLVKMQNSPNSMENSDCQLWFNQWNQSKTNLLENLWSQTGFTLLFSSLD